MKRFYKALLSCVLMLAMLLCSVQGFVATEPAEIVCGNVTGSAGDRVTVAVSVVNNPGFSYLEMTPTYDSKLTLVGVTNGTLFSDLEQGLQYIWSADEDVTKDGLLMTFTFEIPEGTPYGNYSVGFIMRTCGNNNEQSVPFTVKGGTVTVAEAKSSIAEASFELSSSINANFYVSLAAAHQGAKMRFTMNQQETIVEGVASDRNGYQLYCFEGIAPQCMGDSIKAELILNGEVLDTLENYSVRSYCDMVYASSAGALGISQAKYNASKTLIADLLEYGAMSQLYKNYKTNSLVNEGITGQSTFVELDPLDWDKELGATSTIGTEFTGANVWFDNEIQLCFKFTAPNCTEDNFSVRISDSFTSELIAEYTLSDFEVISAEDSYYGIMTSSIPVSQFGRYLTVTLNSITIKRGQKVVTSIQTLDYYSVNAYIFSKQNNRDPNGELTPMAKLARAAYCYGDSAAIYDSVN